MRALRRWTFLPLLLVAQLALATTYHVAPAGNDANDGLTTGTAWKTCQKAVNTASADDTVNFAAGTYTGTCVLSKSGTSGHPITYGPEPGAASIPVLDGSGLSGNVMTMNGVHFIVINSLKFANANQHGISIGTTSTDITLRSIEASSNGGSGVWVLTDVTTTPLNLTITGTLTARGKYHDNGLGGITIWRAPGGYILIEQFQSYNNIGSGNYDGIQVGGGSSDSSTSYVIVQDGESWNNGVGTTGADQIDVGGHALSDYALVQRVVVHGAGGDLKMQNGWGGSTCILRDSQAYGGPGLQNYEHPSPCSIYHNTVVSAGHGWLISNLTGVIPNPGRTFGAQVCLGGTNPNQACAIPGSGAAWDPGIGLPITCVGGGSCTGASFALYARNNAFVNEDLGTLGYLLFLYTNSGNDNRIDVRYTSLDLDNDYYRFDTAGGNGGKMIWDKNGTPDIYTAAQFSSFQANGTDHQEVHGVRSTQTVAQLFIDPVNHNYTPKAGSDLLGHAGPLTTTTSSGSSTTVIPVARASVVMNGWGMIAPDQITVGASGALTVASVDNANNRITVTTPVSFSNGDAVRLVNHVDVGAVQAATATTTTSSTTTTSTSTSSSSSSSSTSTSTPTTVPTTTSTTSTTIPGNLQIGTQLRGVVCRCIYQ